MSEKNTEVVELLKKYDHLMENDHFEEAFKLLPKIKALRPSEFHWRMGDAYEFGYGLSVDYEKSIDHYLKAVNLGDNRWISDVANVYRKMKCYEKSIIYLKKAAIKKQMQSLFHLGNFYEFGKGVRPNQRKAKYYYYLAAKEGHIFSRVRMIMYMCKGELGFIKRFCGLFLIPFAFIEFLFFYIFNPNSKKFDGIV